MAAEMAFLNAPIPGESLTTEPGNRPWENPPQLPSVEEAIEYYTQRILGEVENHDSVLELLETGLPVANAASILNKSSVMNGVHTIDVGILVTPVIEELLMTVADMYDVRYIPSVEALTQASTISSRQAKLLLKEVQNSKKKKSEEPEMMEEVEQPKGLMAKPTTKATGE